MNKRLTMVIITLVIVGLIAICIYLELSSNLTKTTEEIETVKEIDDRISPLTNQGLTVEILRIRHRGLMEKMLKFGTSWRNKPNFYWISYVDGKECNSLGNIGSFGIFNDWDTMSQECRVNYFIEEEQEISDVEIIIVEEVKTGLLGLRKSEVEQEKIRVTYDFRTGRWFGNDNFKDKDGYGHYVGEKFEIWFNIYQSDFDHDGIPYWTEVNILGTDPQRDDRCRDPDLDGIPTSWEWKWGYDPFIWDDHEILDPDVDGIENIEEYQMEKWFADPYQPDIYIETDGMEKRGLIDLEHVFWKESQQMIIERFCQHGINVYIDDGWLDGPINGGGELLPFIKRIDEVVGGQVLSFYKHNFADERKGIFRYIIIANELGWCTPSEYNYYDTILIGSGIRPTYKARLAFTPRFQRVCLAKGALHELGHSIGLMPITFEGNDIMAPIGSRYPSMSEEDYEKFLDEYHSIMNYNYIWRDRKLFDYSDGSNGPPYDQDDWLYIYLPTFQIDAIAYEEPIDETFEDFEVVNENPDISIEGWEFDENITQQFAEQFSDVNLVKNADCTYHIFVKVDEKYAKETSDRNIRVYTQPQVEPVTVRWSLFAEGYLDSKGVIHFYSAEDSINDVLEKIS